MIAPLHHPYIFKHPLPTHQQTTDACRILPGQLHHAIDVLKIKPPLLFWVGLAVAHEVVAPYGEASCKAGVAHCPADGPVEGCIGLVPGADLDAGAAAGAVLVAHPHTGALPDVARPVLVAVVHLFAAVGERTGWAFAGALLTLGTKILQPEIDRFVEAMGRSVVTTAALNRGPMKGWSTQSPILRHLAQACP